MTEEKERIKERFNMLCSFIISIIISILVSINIYRNLNIKKINLKEIVAIGVLFAGSIILLLYRLGYFGV